MNLYEEEISDYAAEFYAYNLIFLTQNSLDFERIMQMIPKELFE